MSWARNIKENGWKIVMNGDFTTTMDNDRQMQKVLTDVKKARNGVVKKINHMCRNPPSPTYHYPTAGWMKWLKGAKIPIIEIRIPSKNNDYRLLFDVLKTGEITIFALANHKGVEKHVRDAAARVHNTPMDKFIPTKAEYLEGSEFEINLEDEELSPKEILIRKRSIQNNLKELYGKDEIEQKQKEFTATANRCSIYEKGDYGLELKTTDEQDKVVELSSPLLLPGVAGTGKSTVLQKRYVNTLLSALRNDEKNGNTEETEKFFSETIFITFNKRLANMTRQILKPLLPEKLHKGIERTVLSLEEWAKDLLRAFGHEITNENEIYNNRDRLTFRKYREWWMNSFQRSYDPAQAWEEFRGVIRGSVEALKSKNGFLSLNEYKKLPSRRAVYPIEQRELFYLDMIEPYKKTLKRGYWDDQTLFHDIIKSKNFSKIYRNIFIDEVQDLTEIQLGVLLDLTIKNEKCICNGKDFCKCKVDCENCKCIIFDATGDISQQVYPSKFRWEDTKKLIYERLDIKCHLAKPLNTSYRSVRSIVDLANWYLEKMNDENRISGHVIEEALTSEAGVLPSILFNKDEDEFVNILIKYELPKPHCPLIVRDEEKKEEVKEFFKKKSLENREFNPLLFVFTIAEVKGLEFNYIITWDFTSGSKHLLKRAFHKKKSNYIGKEEWNLQMEYKHAFVGVTRTRELLLHLSLNHKEYGLDPLMGLLIKEELAVKETSKDLTRFSDVILSDEEYKQIAEGYKDSEMYSAAAAVYRKINMISESIHCDFLSKDEDDIKRAELGRTLSKTKHELNNKNLEEIHKQSFETCKIIKEKTKLKYELLSFHAKKLGLDKESLEAQAEQDELNAKINKKPILWEKAAKTFEQLNKYDRAANAYINAKKFIKAAQSFHLSGNQTKLREVMIKQLEIMSNKDYELMTYVLIPEIIIKRKNQFKMKITQVFGIVLSDEFYKLESFFGRITTIKEHINNDLLNEIEELKAQGDFEKLAEIEIKRNNYIKAWDLYYNEGVIDEGLKKYGDKPSDEEVKRWIEKNQNISKIDWFNIMKCRFKLINSRDVDSSINFFYFFPLISEIRLRGAPKDIETIITAIKLIKNPIPIDEPLCKQKFKQLLKEYHSENIWKNEENEIILFAIRYAMLRTIQATEIKYGNFEELNYNDDQHEILMMLTELVVKYKHNPSRCKDEKVYRKIKDLIFSIIGKLQKIDVIDILFDWSLYCKQLQTYDKKKILMDDLFIMIRIYGNKEEYPRKCDDTQELFKYFIVNHYTDKEDLEKHNGFFPNGYSPEQLFTRVNDDFKINRKDILDRIFHQKKDRPNYISEQQKWDNEVSWESERLIRTLKMLFGMNDKKLDLKRIINETYRSDLEKLSEIPVIKIKNNLEYFLEEEIIEEEIIEEEIIEEEIIEEEIIEEENNTINFEKWGTEEKDTDPHNWLIEKLEIKHLKESNDYELETYTLHGFIKEGIDEGKWQDLGFDFNVAIWIIYDNIKDILIEKYGYSSESKNLTDEEAQIVKIIKGDAISEEIYSRHSNWATELIKIGR